MGIGKHQQTRNRLSLAFLALGCLLAPRPAQALTWSWNFLAGSDRSASATLTTAGHGTPTPGLYTVTAITGSFTSGGTSYAIIGLSLYLGADNKFNWGGTPGEALNVSNQGISFTTNAPTARDVNYYSASGLGYLLNTDNAINSVLSSSVSPVVPVPGPLPLLGAGSAYVFSRRLRSRLAGSRTLQPSRRRG
jgi:hypothetical protein